MLKHLLFFFTALALTNFSQAQTFTTTRVATDDAANPLIGGNTNQVVLGFSVDKTAGASNFTNLVISTGATNPNDVFSSVALFSSASDFASAANTNATVTLNASNITFAGNPSNLFAFGAGASTRYFYVVATIRNDVATSVAANPSIGLSFTEANTTYSAGTENAFTVTGSTFEFQALTADFTQGADDAAALGDQNGVELLDFTVLSNGTSAGQTIVSPLVFTFSTDVTGILENWDLQVGGADIPGTEIYTLSGDGLTLTITAFTAVTIETIKNFQLFADIKSTANGTDFTINLASTGPSVNFGSIENFTTFTNTVDITALTADFTQNADDATAIGDQNGVELMDFSVLSNGTQSLTPSLVFTFNKDVTNILENWDLRVGGADIAGTEIYTLSGDGLTLTITAFSNIDVSTSKNFQLLADIKSVAVSADDFTISLASSGTAVNLGYPEIFTTFTNSIDITALTADFTQNADDATAVAGQTIELLDFTVVSNASGTTHTLNSPLVLTFNKDVSGILASGDLRVGGVDIPGTETYTLNGAGTQLTIAAFNNVDITTAKNFQLYVTLDANATITDDFTVTLAQAGITLSGGYVETFGTFTNSVDVVTSQLSRITLNAGTTANINYISFRGTSMNDNSSNSVSIANFRLQDGNGTNDADNKKTRLTALTLQLTNYQYVRRIALYNASNNQEITGTEQLVDQGAGGVVSFDLSGVTVEADDDGTKDIIVRVTFLNTVTDNQEVHVSITSATALNTGSGFAASNAGGASTSTLAPTNVINVIASSLSFSNTSLPNTTINTNFSLSISARDAQNNLDTDYNGQIDLTRSPANGTLTAQPGQTVTGAAISSVTPGVYDWTTLRLSQAGTYTLTASDDAYNDEFTNPTATITVTSSACDITTASLSNLCFGGNFQTLGNIVITETDNSGISGTNGSYTMSLSLPSGFVFDQSVTAGLVLGGGADISTPSVYSYPGDNVVQFSFTLAGTSNINTITIGGLKVRRPHPGSVDPPNESGNITRLGGTANISGVGPSTVLGSVSATEDDLVGDNVSFTVEKVNPTDIDVDPNETRFTQTSNPVRLVGNPSGGVFTGSGVTFVSGQYRFNPSSLSIGNYEITYTVEQGADLCDYIEKKTFEVYETAITNLSASYCNNSPQTLTLNIDSWLAANSPGWTLQRFAYGNYAGGRLANGTLSPGAPIQWVNLGNIDPASSVFNPALADYQPVYAASAPYWGTNGILIGFFITDGVTTKLGSYVFVPVKSAPTPTFTMPKYSFCSDEAAVVLDGTPDNSNTIADDFFSEDGPGNSVTVSPSNPRVWSFSPQAVGGAATFNITYTYRDAATGCSGTSAPVIINVYTRPSSVTGGTITSPGGTSPATCQGFPVGTFTANPVVGTTYTWYSDQALTSQVGTGNSFTPPNPPVDPSIATNPGGPVFPHKFYVTQTINGCESNKEPSSPSLALELTVNINPTPDEPVVDFTRDYCVGEAIAPADFVIGAGTAIKWYEVGNTTPLLTNNNSPSAADIANILKVNSSVEKTFLFDITQTVAGCEGLPNPTRMTVIIKPIPNLSVVADADLATICKTDPTVTFKALDNGNAAGVDQPGEASSWTGISEVVPNPGFGTATLNPALLTPGNYNLNFSFTNSSSCSNNINVPLTILATIVPNVQPLDSCFGVFVDMNNLSTIDNGTLPTAAPTIQYAQWNFGDGTVIPPGLSNNPIATSNTIGTYFNPDHKFAFAGGVTITYTMETSDGCRVSGTESLTINRKPEIEFNWRNACLDTLSNLTNTQFLAVEQSNPIIPISQYNWNFKVNNILNYSSAGGGATPTVSYNSPGSDIVELIVITNAQCRDTLSKPVYVVPSFTAIRELNAYSQGFELNADNWIIGGTNPSWELGTPAGLEINTSPSGPASANSWVTNLNGQNNPNESSWVLSKCFNFHKAEKPVIAIDIWSDTPSGIDGAVLQYNENGVLSENGSAPPENWKTIGTSDEGAGINWYDDSGIATSPGNQLAFDYGWTGKHRGWKRAIFKLDELIGKTNVSFRIAFSSINGREEGFAFDNVFIGERSRVVLLESFTNTSAEANTTTFNATYNNFGTAAEVVKIQYHTPFPDNDALNSLNPRMNNARTAFYGITSAPSIRIDGKTVTNFVEGLTEFNKQVLTPSPIRISVTATKDVGSTFVKINTRIINNSNTEPAFINGANVFTTIVEKTIEDPDYLGATSNIKFKYVAKDILPTPSGIKINQDIPAGGFIDIEEILWEDRNLIESDSGAIVIHVQNINADNKSVFQSFFFDPSVEPDLVTETEDPEYASKINLYPNPANQELQVVLPAPVAKPTLVNMVDAYGKVAHQLTFNTGEQQRAIRTTELTAGVYIVQIGTPEGGMVYRKVVITH